jgi:hypothetical protein
LPRTNTLAYFCPAVNDTEKVLKHNTLSVKTVEHKDKNTSENVPKIIDLIKIFILKTPYD